MSRDRALSAAPRSGAAGRAGHPAGGEGGRGKQLPGERHGAELGGCQDGADGRAGAGLRCRRHPAAPCHARPDVLGAAHVFLAEPLAFVLGCPPVPVLWPHACTASFLLPLVLSSSLLSRLCPARAAARRAAACGAAGHAAEPGCRAAWAAGAPPAGAHAAHPGRRAAGAAPGRPAAAAGQASQCSIGGLGSALSAVALACVCLCLLPYLSVSERLSYVSLCVSLHVCAGVLVSLRVCLCVYVPHRLHLCAVSSVCLSVPAAVCVCVRERRAAEGGGARLGPQGRRPGVCVSVSECLRACL